MIERENIMPEIDKKMMKITFFALCIALFFFVLYFLFYSQIGRYKTISNGRTYIDTATGRIYATENGELISSPQ